jgi:hypothetical protein
MELLMKSFKQFVIEADKKDTIIMDIPLMIRVLELAREDIKSDMDLHRVVEKLIDIRNKGTLTMDDYDFIANIKESYMKEDGVAVPGPTNVVGTGAIAGSGGKGGEPGVYLKKKRKVVLQPMNQRAAPRM